MTSQMKYTKLKWFKVKHNPASLKVFYLQNIITNCEYHPPKIDHYGGDFCFDGNNIGPWNFWKLEYCFPKPRA